MKKRLSNPKCMPIRPAFVIAAGLISLISTAASGCTITPPVYYVNSDFVILFTSKPTFAHVRVGLSPVFDSDLGTYSAVTDDSGLAHFKDVKAGKYNLSVLSRQGFADLEVGTGDPKLELAWTTPEILETNSVQGSFTSGQIPVAGLRLRLKAADSGSFVEETKTSKDGEFRFKNSANGFYLLDVGEHENSPAGLEGTIPLFVNSSSAVNVLNVEAGETSCGLTYVANCRSTPSRPIVVRNLAGVVVDAVGAIVPRANTELISSHDKHMSLKLDTDARFACPHCSGNYTLVVSYPGFSPLRLPIAVNPNGADRKLRVSLSPLGSCSSAGADQIEGSS
jgi:hypothetical protein